MFDEDRTRRTVFDNYTFEKAGVDDKSKAKRVGASPSAYGKAIVYGAYLDYTPNYAVEPCLI
jgi:hypothetical protein